MRQWILIGVAAALFGCARAATESPLAPDFSLESGTGESVHLDEVVEGRATILFFWATWCPYCKALMPHLQSIRLEYGDQVQILAISVFDDADPVAFIRDAGYEFTVLPNGDEVAKRYDISGTPGVILVDGSRHMRFDLRALPPIELPQTEEPSSHRRKAAYITPYWAAAIRLGIDRLLEE